MKAKLISAIVVLLMLIGSFGAVGTNTNEDECNCNNHTSLGYSLYDPDDPLLGLVHDENEPPLDEGYIFPEYTVPEIFSWREADIDEETGYGIPGDKNYAPGIRDQARCGSCYAFGALASLEGTINIEDDRYGGDGVDLSEQHIVSCGGSGIFGCDGAYYSSTMNFVSNNGVYLESCFDYSSGSGNVESCGNNECDTPDYRADKIDWHPVDSSTSNIQRALVTHGPLVAAVYVPQEDRSFYDYPNGGHVDSNKVYSHSGSRTNHMVCIIGYNNDWGCWICKNSWGSSWGLNGLFRIAYGSCGINGEASYFTYVSGGDPDVDIGIETPNSGSLWLVDEEIDFTSRAEGDAPPFYYKWDFGDGSNSGGWSRSNDKVTHSYQQEGTYNVELRVKDNMDHISSVDISLDVIQDSPKFTITVTKIEEVDCIDPDPLAYLGIYNEAEWFYEISWKGSDQDSWKSKTFIAPEGDVVYPNKPHMFPVLGGSADIKIKLMEDDVYIPYVDDDDLADISSEPGGGKDDSTPDKAGAIYHLTYDLSSDDQSFELDGSDDGESGAQNDAKFDFTISGEIDETTGNIVSPNDGDYLMPNTDITFEGSASGGYGSYNYKWDFGDGTKTEWLTNSSTTHIYGSGGERTVTLKVRDSIGNGADDTATIDVIVYSNPTLYIKSGSVGDHNYKLELKAYDPDGGDARFGIRPASSDDEDDFDFTGWYEVDIFHEIDVKDYCDGENQVDIIAEDEQGLRSSVETGIESESKEKSSINPLFSLSVLKSLQQQLPLLKFLKFLNEVIFLK
jgi:hypothetical protein